MRYAIQHSLLDEARLLLQSIPLNPSFSYTLASAYLANKQPATACELAEQYLLGNDCIIHPSNLKLQTLFINIQKACFKAGDASTASNICAFFDSKSLEYKAVHTRTIEALIKQSGLREIIALISNMEEGPAKKALSQRFLSTRR